MNRHERGSRAGEALRGSSPERRETRFKWRQLLIVGLLVLGVHASIGCQKAPLKAVDLTADDLCARCRDMVAEKQYAAEFIGKDGFVRKFDDISCMVQQVKTKVKKENIEAYFMVDYLTKEWIPAQEAKYVRSDKFKTPKDGGVLAFKDAAKAQALAAQYQAQVLSFDELMK